MPEIKRAYLEKHDAKVEELLANVELILSDADILQEIVRQGITTAKGSESTGTPVRIYTCDRDPAGDR